MNKTWFFIEKNIGALISIWGIIALFGVVNAMNNAINNGYTSSQNITYGQLIFQNHLSILLAIASVFGGVMLISNDKRGWMLCVICVAMFIVSFVWSSRMNATDTERPYHDFFKGYAIMAFAFMALLILLLQKPFRKKYQPTLKNWLWMLFVTAILVIDKIIL